MGLLVYLLKKKKIKKIKHRHKNVSLSQHRLEMNFEKICRKCILLL